MARAGPYYCRICDETFNEIPADAVLIKKHTAQSAEEK